MRQQSIARQILATLNDKCTAVGLSLEHADDLSWICVSNVDGIGVMLDRIVIFSDDSVNALCYSGIKRRPEQLVFSLPDDLDLFVSTCHQKLIIEEQERG